ncbi:MAG: arsenite S-adenosylmethyltransferase, partial [Gemmatimonadetes bacterium]|nr:arsenite S-adenosylmethyltransferase [Gemmatimonadota bacterium]
GGRFAVSDVVVRGEVSPEIRRSMELWVGCVAGALEEKEFESLLLESGFEDASLEPTRVYKAEDARQFLEDAGLDADEAAGAIDGRFMSAFVRARKPGGEAKAFVGAASGAAASPQASDDSSGTAPAGGGCC